MDIRKVKKLIELLEESGLAELEITEGEESVRISRHITGAPMQYAMPPMQYAATPAPAPPLPPARAPALPARHPPAAARRATRCCRRWWAPTTRRQPRARRTS